MTAVDSRRHSAAAERNCAPIAVELQRRMPAQGVMLEIASGSGQHAAHFATLLPRWRWIASDAEPGALASIRAWCGDVANVSDVLTLDVMQPHWAGVPPQVDAIFNANMLHIAPWPTCAALMQGAARHLAPLSDQGGAGLLLLYGPFIVDDEATAPSNLAFDADLRARNPAWGLRRLADVEQQAAAAGLTLSARVPMPAHNLLLVWRRDQRGLP